MNKKIIFGLALILVTGSVYASINKDLAVNYSSKYIETDEAVTLEVTDVEKKKVEEIKKIFNISGDYESFTILSDPMNSDSGSDYLNKLIKNKSITTYRWSDEKLGELSVSYTSDGEFISYSKWTSSNEENNKKKYSKDNALKAAENILKKAIKDFDKKYILSDYSIRPGSDYIDLTYQRLLAGIPLADNYLNVSFSTETGEISDMMLMGDNSYAITFLKDEDFKGEAKISLEDAQKIFLEKSPLTLSYKVTKDGKSVEKVFSSDVVDIDALTGKVFKNNLRDPFMPYATEEAKDSAGLSEVEVKKIDGLKDLKKKSEAKDKALEIVGKSYTVESISLTSDKDNYYYRINLENEKNPGSLLLNAKTLKLVSLDIYNDKRDVKTKVTDEEAKKIALDFLEKYGDKTELNLEKIDVKKFDYTTIPFIPRFVNSLPVLGEGVTIAVDDEKNVVTYEKYFSTADFSKAKDIALTKDEANKIYLNSKNFGLKYEMTEEGPKLLYGKIKNIVPLVGEDKILRDKFGNVVNFKNQISYEDFDNAKNKEAINYLKDMEIGTIGKKLSDKITYKEFIELISRNYGWEYYDDNRYGFDMNKVKDKKIPERDVIKFLIIDNSLQDFTKAKGIFKDDLFKNQKSLKEYENYYIIARGFGYIGDEINPDKELNLEEILYIIYNSIK
ncbi:YcdB/YcdC domain-containing protein [Peptoniphilus porci]|uniref:S-layer protein n=1 Tax=Peptoniphilus porci TaxID=2652280 RepID=A0A1U7M1T2_9FIRM|nr:YcdB/YcdC domain-containing protein [Peptoniphilus porci]OLR65609.1 S-layer protein [Peptoniphilus porci]